MLGIDLFSSSIIFSAILCLFAGVLSFLSPCVLPILPPYLAYMAGTTVSEIKNNNETIKKGVLLSSISFSLGLSVVFILLGLAANSMASILIFYQNELRIGSGLLIIIFGLHFIGLLRVPFLQKELRLNLDIKKRGNFLPPFFLGLTFAFGWTPCIGPVLGSIITLSAAEATISKGIILLSFYSLGLAIPFILSGYYMTIFLKSKKSFIKFYGVVNKTGGSILLLTGILILTNQIQVISYYILTTFPFLTKFG